MNQTLMWRMESWRMETLKLSVRAGKLIRLIRRVLFQTCVKRLRHDNWGGRSPFQTFIWFILLIIIIQRGKSAATSFPEGSCPWCVILLAEALMSPTGNTTTVDNKKTRRIRYTVNPLSPKSSKVQWQTNIQGEAAPPTTMTEENKTAETCSKPVIRAVLTQTLIRPLVHSLMGLMWRLKETIRFKVRLCPTCYHNPVHSGNEADDKL